MSEVSEVSLMSVVSLLILDAMTPDGTTLAPVVTRKQ